MTFVLLGVIAILLSIVGFLAYVAFRVARDMPWWR